jgi:hypothetical protein
MAYISLFHYIHAYTVFKLELKLNELRGGPLVILGGGVADQKKNSWKELDQKKKFLQALGERKKIRATS